MSQLGMKKRYGSHLPIGLGRVEAIQGPCFAILAGRMEEKTPSPDDGA